MNSDEELFGFYEGICAACDAHARVNDLGLCEECDEKLDRDFIRKRDWDYSASAFGCPPDKLEELRDYVIRMHGEALELLADEDDEGSA
ncbi:hypothetical protein JW905_12230 [bacterium]|nr:hypothetical protein [candidate division CSSED10-310 bacterium]